ncbi:MAG: Unknown protein [uncultured Thiotrichaceae bacterium]|uniref:Uncharacterized protein n=1 Tax=uncultured Thiotrichaceae bacterium TaxID=298394 RepID=A0A6S6UHS9_9GAMM|nr:MAG: Unknown protein [uncultured Thiotrichaceae bacterium]
MIPKRLLLPRFFLIVTMCLIADVVAAEPQSMEALWSEAIAAHNSADRRIHRDDNDEEDDNESEKAFNFAGSIGFFRSINEVDDERKYVSEVFGWLDASYQPTDYIKILVSLLNDQKAPFEVAEGYLKWDVPTDLELQLSAGKKYAPFGNFNSEMISYTSPGKLGETNPEGAIEARYQQNSLAYHLYLFKGSSSDRDTADEYDAGYVFATRYDADNITLGLDYLSNLVESNAFDDKDVKRKIPALVFYALKKLGNITLKAEHLAATRSLSPGDLNDEVKSFIKPSASQIELVYDIAEKKVLALAWNQADDAKPLELDKSSVSINYSQAIYKQLSGAVELSRYENSEGDKGNLLIVEFSLDI